MLLARIGAGAKKIKSMSIIRKIMEFFRNVFSCEKCNSKDTHKGYYTRGWNDWCGQAYGDRGYYCNRCGHITFESNIEEHEKTLPKWCHPYKKLDKTTL